MAEMCPFARSSSQTRRRVQLSLMCLAGKYLRLWTYSTYRSLRGNRVCGKLTGSLAKVGVVGDLPNTFAHLSIA